MLLILISLTLLGVGVLFHGPETLSHTAVIFHEQCLRSLPNTLENLKSLEAIVCGEKLENIELKHLLMQSSLIHIFIVSGAHFLFLHKLLAFAFRSRWLPFIPLAGYALATLCQPPAVRSLIYLLLVEISRQKKLFMSPVLLIFVSGLLSVSLFPDWMTSRSLLMSLLAALVIAFMGALWGRERRTLPAIFVTQSAVYVVMGTALWGFATMHPLGILLNILIGPLVGLVLFPVSLATVLVPTVGFVFDAMIDSLKFVLAKTDEVLQVHGEGSQLSMLWQWGLFVALLIGSYQFLVRQRRRKIHGI